MKRVICLLLLMFLFVAPMTGCQSKEEKALEDAKQAARNLEKNAQDAQSQYEELKKDVSEYQDAVSRLDSAR